MVREVEKEDLDELLELYLCLHEDSIPEQSKYLSDIWRQILEDENHHLIVNEIDGKIVSSCVCVIIPNLTRNVRPFRNRGLASECLEYAKQIAKQHNCYKMMLLTGSKKKETLDFYIRAGYNSTDKTAFIQWLDV